MWKKFVSILLCFVITFCHSSNVFADDVKLPTITVPADEADVGNALSPMKKGEKAPFTGVLLSPRAIATIITQINSSQAQIDIEIWRARAEERATSEFKLSEQKIKLETDGKILQIQLDARQKEIAVLNEQLKKEQASQISRPFWTSVGAVGGVVVSILIVFGVSSATKLVRTTYLAIHVSLFGELYGRR